MPRAPKAAPVRKQVSVALNDGSDPLRPLQHMPDNFLPLRSWVDRTSVAHLERQDTEDESIEVPKHSLRRQESLLYDEDVYKAAPSAPNSDSMTDPRAPQWDAEYIAAVNQDFSPEA